MSGVAIVPPNATTSPSFSHGILVDDRFLYIAGQLALNADGTAHAPYDLEGQLEKVWSQIETIVETAGGSLGDVVRVTAWTTDRAYVAPIVEARRKRFESLTPPASALLIVAGLARPEFLVEIDGFAVL